MKYTALFFILSLVLISCNASKVVEEKKECDSRKDKSCQPQGNLENDVILHVEEKEESTQATSQSALYNKISKCEEGYIKISSFCVMREEAKKDGRYKINTHSPEEAQKICQQLGKKLITHKEWLEIAQKISEQKINFDEGKTFVPSRELFLDKETTIVDFASSQPEWIAWSHDSLYLPSHCQPHTGKAYLSSCDGDSFGQPDISGFIYKAKIHNKEKMSLVRSGSLMKHQKKLYNLYIGNPPSQRAYGVRCTYSL